MAKISIFSNPAHYARWHYISQGRIKRSNLFRAAIAFLFRGIVSLITAVMIGIVLAMLSHPIIGIIAGILFFVACISFSTRDYGIWSGNCPHCQEPISVQLERGETRFNCQSCKKSVVLESRNFVSA